jgi:hypothetical protein
MPRKPIELPPDLARAFVADMLAYYAESNAIRAAAAWPNLSPLTF